IYTQLDHYIHQLWLSWQKSHPKSEILLLSDHGFQLHRSRILLGNYFYQQKILDQRAGTKQKANQLLKKTGLTLKNNSPFELMGRSGWGQVYLSPQHNSNQVYQLLKHHCSQITDPDTNKPVISKVWRKSVLYQGKNLDILPDFMIQPANGYSI